MKSTSRLALLALLALLVAAALSSAAQLAAQEPISLSTEDGGLIHADLYGQGERAVVLAHGGRFSKASWASQARTLAAAGFRVMALDFRGYGASRGPGDSDVLSAPLYLDVLAAVRWLRANGAKSVAVIGGSMGGGAAAEASIHAAPGEIDRLVLLAPMVIKTPEKIRGEKLYIVSRDDMGPGDKPRLPKIREQFEQAPEPKQWLLLEGSAHAQALFETDQRERLIAEILRFLSATAPSHAAEYDPLKVAATTPQHVDLVARDTSRSREIPLRVYLPATRETAPVVLFSHGLGGSRENSAYLGEHWARRGYVAVFLQHPGSDEMVWKNRPLNERLGAMKSAASLENFLLRARDVPAVLDQLTAWSRSPGHSLTGRLDLDRVGMSGHSFGAVTTQAVSGQAFALGGPFTEKRIRAAVLMSPSVPKRGDPKRAFGEVEIPWLLLTGTHDEAIIGGATVESRLAVYPALPPGNKYELVLHGAEHSAFSDRPLPGDQQARNPNHHRVILALTTAFWDAWLRGDVAAREWLEGEGPRRVLEKNDRWQHK